jgi:hypothetical protein
MNRIQWKTEGSEIAREERSARGREGIAATNTGINWDTQRCTVVDEVAIEQKGTHFDTSMVCIEILRGIIGWNRVKDRRLRFSNMRDVDIVDWFSLGEPGYISKREATRRGVLSWTCSRRPPLFHNYCYSCCVSLLLVEICLIYVYQELSASQI